MCHTTKRQFRMKRSQMQNIRTFGCQTMIGIRVGFVPFVANLFSIGVLAIVAICRRSIYVLGDFDMRERLADVPSILGLHCEGVVVSRLIAFCREFRLKVDLVSY